MERHNLQALEVDGRIIFKRYFKDMMGNSGLDSPSGRHRPVVGFCGHIDEISSYIKFEECL